MPKVLVVDDEALIALTVKRILEKRLGYEVQTAVCGVEALEKAEQMRPDLMLLDVRMPDMDGFEVCRAVKGNPTTASVVVIYVSAYAAPPDGLLACGEGYLSKPVQPTALIETVKNFLS